MYEIDYDKRIIQQTAQNPVHPVFTMKRYCRHCGHLTQWCVPEGDSRPREVCTHCGEIHYENPKIITGCLAVWETRVLLCRRAIEPRRGLWTLPAGFMENGESMQQGAVRETWEEAQATVELCQLYALFNLPQISQVYGFFLGQLSTPDCAPGEESLEVGLFGQADIPWGELAFSVVGETLKLYFQDCRQGRFPLHMGDIYWQEQHGQARVVMMDTVNTCGGETTNLPSVTKRSQ